MKDLPRREGWAEEPEPPASAAAERTSIRFRAPAGLSAWRLDVDSQAFAILELPASAAAVVPSARLTEAEAEVASYLLAGLSNQEIAHRRGTAPRTVANQVASIFRKLGVRSRIELSALAAAGPPEEKREWHCA
jgi:DNA-binding CsgD family transcriptional regulator